MVAFAPDSPTPNVVARDPGTGELWTVGGGIDLGVAITNGVVTLSGITFTAAATITIAANTALALRVTDGTTNLIVIDTRNTVTGVTGVQLRGAPPTIVSAAGTTWSAVGVPAVTVTLTGGVGVTALNGAILQLGTPTITSAAATTVTTASTLYVNGAPAAGGSVTITNPYAVLVAAGASFFGGRVTVTAGTAVNMAGAFGWNGGVNATDATQSTGFFVGQDVTHGAEFVWEYNATAGNADALIRTFGTTNPLLIQASNWSVTSAGQIQVANARIGVGTVGAPTLSFYDDPDTGIYDIAANDLGFSLGGLIGFRMTGVASSVLYLNALPATTGGRALLTVAGEASGAMAIRAMTGGDVAVGDGSTNRYFFRSTGLSLTDAVKSILDGTAAGEGELLKFTGVASAVNEVTIANAATAGIPVISATGGDAAVSLRIASKSTGSVIIAINSQDDFVFASNRLNMQNGAYITFAERTAPSAPSANGAHLYAQDNGAGKTQLMALFATGVAQQVAIEP